MTPTCEPFIQDHNIQLHRAQDLVIVDAESKPDEFELTRAHPTYGDAKEQLNEIPPYTLGKPYKAFLLRPRSVVGFD